MTLIPEDHVRWNNYWHGMIDPNPRPDDPRQPTFSRVRNVRATLNRFDPRRDYTKPSIGEDSRFPVKMFDSLDRHVEFLKERLAQTMRLQLVHVAGSLEISSLTKPSAESPALLTGQSCMDCGGDLIAPRFFRPQLLLRPDLADLVFDDNGDWKVGTRILECQRGRWAHDRTWDVVAPNDETPPGYVRCKAALDAL